MGREDAAAAAAATLANGGGCGDGRRCQLHEALISQRELISHALARETEGLSSPGGGARAPSSRAAKTTTATMAAPEPETEGRGNPDKPSPGGGGLTTLGNTAKAGDGGGAEESGNESGVVPSTAPAAPVVATAVLDAPAVPNVPRAMCQNSGTALGKLWPSTSSSGRSKHKDAAAAAAAAAAPAAEGMGGTQPVTSGATSINGGGMEPANGEAATAPISSE